MAQSDGRLPVQEKMTESEDVPNSTLNQPDRTVMNRFNFLKQIHKIQNFTDYIQTKLKTNRQKTKLLVHTGSPITILPRISADVLNLCTLSKLATKYHEVNESEVKFEAKDTVPVGKGKNRNQLPVMISSRSHFTPLPTLGCFDALKFVMRIKPIASILTENHSEIETIRRL